jgi:hypothetical protein
VTQPPLFELPSQAFATETEPLAPAPKLCKATMALESAFPTFAQGYDYPYATAAEWSTHDLIFYLLKFTGPIHLTAATWSVSAKATILLKQALQAKQLLSIRFLVDWRVRVRTPEFIALAREGFGDVRISNCHAKAFVMHNAEWSVSVVGSANFTNNPRIEAGHISTNPEVADFHKNWINQEIDRQEPFGMNLSNEGRSDTR